MKTVEDLLNLIIRETLMNEGKVIQFTFNIDTRYQTVSMYQNDAGKEPKDAKTLIQGQTYGTKSTLQLAYWQIYNFGRSKHEEL